MHQPVYVGDLLDGLFNGMESKNSYLINAVGPIAMSQEEMIKFFLDLAGKSFKPIRIPYEVATIIAKHFPKGRIAPYSVSLLKHLEKHDAEPLDGRPFCDLVGKPLSSMQQIYSFDQPIGFSKSPIYEHIKEIINCIAINPEARRDFLRIGCKYGPALILDAIKQYFGLSS